MELSSLSIRPPWTSNVFALLGLRSLYFALAGVMDKFHDHKVGLGMVLTLAASVARSLLKPRQTVIHPLPSQPER